MRKDFGVQDWFYPLPVLIVGSYDENGNPDAMNAAWGGVYKHGQVMLCLSEGHKTTKNIKKNKAFTVSFADANHVVEADYVGIVSGNKEPQKVEKSGLTTTKSTFVNAPIINEFPLSMECELLKVTEEGNIIGKVINVSIDENYLNEDEKLDMTKFSPISFDPVNNLYFKLGESVGKAFQEGQKLNK